MKHFFTTFLILIPLLIACNKEAKTPINKGENKFHAREMKVDSSGLSKTKAILKTIHGNIIFKFYPKKAPNTVTRIIELIDKSFYDGLVFHRVIPNFVIQTGDPNANGTGGSGQKLKAEFNDIQHIKGTVAMARRSNDVDSADSQFYIARSTLPHLNNKYTVFAQVVEGLDVINKVTQGDKILSLTIVK